MVGIGWLWLVLVLVCCFLGVFLIERNVEFITEFTDFSGKCDNGRMTEFFLKKEGNVAEAKKTPKASKLFAAELLKTCLMSP